jgi:hypothetical protein
MERILETYDAAYGLKSISLRYFNAAGATQNCGEDHEPETHLIPNVLAEFCRPETFSFELAQVRMVVSPSSCGRNIERSRTFHPTICSESFRNGVMPSCPMVSHLNLSGKIRCSCTTAWVCHSNVPESGLKLAFRDRPPLKKCRRHFWLSSAENVSKAPEIIPTIPGEQLVEATWRQKKRTCAHGVLEDQITQGGTMVISVEAFPFRLEYLPASSFLT